MDEKDRELMRHQIETIQGQTEAINRLGNLLEGLANGIPAVVTQLANTEIFMKLEGERAKTQSQIEKDIAKYELLKGDQNNGRNRHHQKKEKKKK